MSPETALPVFPDRLIHPLPKRRLRERLSPDVAGTIKYPPSQKSGSSLFYYPFNLKDDSSFSSERSAVVGKAGEVKSSEPITSLSTSNPTTSTSIPQTKASPAAGVAAGQTVRLPSHTRRPSTEPESPSAARVARLANLMARHGRTTSIIGHQPLLSTASATETYECCENTNNKKKRKIPTAGDTPLSGSYTSTDLHSAASASYAANSIYDSGVSSPLSANYSGTASFASVSPGISGPGRGRYGRTRGGRSPLHAMTDANAKWTGRYGKLWSPWPMPTGMPQHDGEKDIDDIAPTPTQGQGNNGIISSAIAKAEKQVSHDQENDTHTDDDHDQDYEDQLSALSTPASAQFTFTCSSQVPGNFMWPESDSKMQPGSPYIPGRMRGGGGPGIPGSRAGGTDCGSSTDSSFVRREKHDAKKRRANKIKQEIKAQIRDRRRAQMERNAANTTNANPQQADDFYVCPFCDYEIITGKKSKLITAFELKERKKRLEAERRQRERTKDRSRNKGRRGRKATVSNADAGANANTGTNANANANTNVAVPHEPEAGNEPEYEVYDDGAGEAYDVVPELRSGIGDIYVQIDRSHGSDNNDSEASQPRESDTGQLEDGDG